MLYPRIKSLRLLALAFAGALAMPSHAQDVAAFVDFMDRYHVFDKGTFRQVESLPPLWMQYGDHSVFYGATNDDLKVYRDGRSQRLERTSRVGFRATDHLGAYKLANALKVYENGTTKVLCQNAGAWAVDDSLVGWFDEVQRTFNVYYRGEVQVLEDALANEPIHSWKSGDNLFAWVTNLENKLKVFYHGYIYELTPQATKVQYEASLDMVIYQDSQDNGFYAFLRGEIIHLESVMPLSYKVGKGTAAYIDVTGSLKVLSGTKVYTAYPYEPQEYHVIDSLVIIKDRDRIRVFADGQLQELENFWPTKWVASWGTLAYIDENKAIKVWHKGHKEVALQRDSFVDFNYDRNLLLVTMPNRRVKVWWNGQIYSH